MANDRLYLDFHVIQTVPPSCVNRDDTGSPKTALYGGHKRARVSSQCWKSAMRKIFREHLDHRKLGTRSKRIVDMVAEKITGRDGSVAPEQARVLAEMIINAAGIQTGDGMAKALFFMSDFQADSLAALALQTDLTPAADADAGEKKKKGKKADGIPDGVKKAAKSAVNGGHGVDMALFGRMVADDASLNADASAQVAHAISTHKVDNEFDYYTARDDRAPNDNPGADMIGTIEFNSATLYRYATVAVHDLFRQLGKDGPALAEAVREFARSFLLSMPTGKQNTFANQTVPHAVMVALRTDQPINLADAFEEPVRASETGGFARLSVERLARHAGKVCRTFVSEPERIWLLGEDWEEGGPTVALADLLGDLEQEMHNRFDAPGSQA